MKRIIFIGIPVVIFVALIGIYFQMNRHIPISKNIPMANSLNQNTSAEDIPQTSIVAQNLEIPWGMVFLPEGGMMITERPGRVRYIDPHGFLLPEPIATISQVKTIGEGGLLGIALDPDFSQNHLVYLYYTYAGNGNNTLNRVVKMTYQDGKLNNEQTIVDAIPGNSNHDGGRIKFGPDNFLYITTGDAQDPSLAQSRNSLAGKILRATTNGAAAPGNPFGTRVYSYGHRNPQGIAWDDQDQLWSTEHGRSGALSGLDELNLIEPGKNYGWDIIQGNEIRNGMVTPRLNSGGETWAPGGLTFLNGKLYFTGLRGKSLYEVNVTTPELILKKHFENQFGRIRDVVVGPGNMLYIATSNRDGRGNPGDGDDKIIRVNPQKL